MLHGPLSHAARSLRCTAGLARAARQALLVLLPADVTAALPPHVREAIAAGGFARAGDRCTRISGIDEQARVTAR